MSVLVPAAGVSRAQLEVTPERMRRARRLVPDGARWQGYRQGRLGETSRRATRVIHKPATVMRWAGGRAGLGGEGTEWRPRDIGLANVGVVDDQAARPEETKDAWRLAGKHAPKSPSIGHCHAHWLGQSKGDKVTDPCCGCRRASRRSSFRRLSWGAHPCDVGRPATRVCPGAGPPSGYGPSEGRLSRGV